MTDPIKTRSNLLADLARAKALFQQRAIMAVLMEGALGSKPDQEGAADFQSVATPARSTAWPPAERQTAPGGSRAWAEVVKPQEYR